MINIVDFHQSQEEIDVLVKNNYDVILLYNDLFIEIYHVNKFEPPIKSSSSPINYATLVGFDITSFIKMNKINNQESVFITNFSKFLTIKSPVRVSISDDFKWKWLRKY